MPRKGENIYKRKDGRWEGRYIRSYDSEHKAKYAYVYGKTYSEVKRKLTEQRGNVQKVQPTKNKSSTYGELLDCWLHSMQLNTKESTQARYTHLIKTHIKPHLGAVQLSQLTTDAIEIFIEQQLTDGRLDNSGGLSPKTVTDILTIIKSTIEYARYKELPVICNLSKLSIKKKEKEMRVFTPSEQESLIGTLTNDMDHSKFTSYWRPLEGTDPYIGKAGEISCEPEIKAEVTVFKEKVDETIEAIKKVHPYEEPVINVIPIWRTSF